MTRSPRDLTDEELRRECELLPAERALIEQGDKLAMVGLAVYPLLVLILWAMYRAPLTLSAILPIALGALCPGLVLTLIGVAAVGRAAERRATARARPYVEELADRHLLGPMQNYVERAKQAVRVAEAPDYVLLFSGKSQPHGGDHTVRVTLWGKPKPSALLEWGAGDVTITREAGISVRSGKAELSGKAASELAKLVEAHQPREFADVRAKVIDGFPCSVILVRGEPLAIQQANCNLGDAITSATAEAPALRLAAMLWELVPRAQETE